jgi:DNA polymerase
MDWDVLEGSIRECTRCGLCEGRQHAVPGVGDRAARWLFVGEGPGRNEDLQGEPFVGPAGQLLDNMLRALDLARGKDTYIANIVKCRPVGADGRDRPPTPDEVDACMPYLRRQIALIRPQVIIALGKTAAVSLLGLPADTALAGLRGEPREFDGIPLVITYHPAYLLRQPADKAKTWRDLCLAKHIIDGA